MTPWLVSSVLALPLAVGAAGYPVHRENTTTKTLKFADAAVPGVRTLDARTISGAIRVSGYDGVDVQLEARTRIAAESEEMARTAEREVRLETSDGAPTIEVVVREDGHAGCGERSNGRTTAWWDRARYQAVVDLTIHVPRGTRLRLCTVNGTGHIENTTADFDVASVNGSITLEHERGSGRAETVNGTVTATFDAAPRSASLFKTVNGRIDVTLPTDLAADLRLKTFNGGLFTDFDVVPQPARAEASPSLAKGRFVYRSGGFTTVRVGKGGPELTFEALNGDVRVLRAR